jgi:hypothetical protein
MPRRCSSCTPEGHHTPSGFAFYHEASCSLFANQKVSSAMAMAESTGHPAGSSQNATMRFPTDDLATWFSHEDHCICPSCRYVEAHMDDEL